jgi:hypothetical protein
MRAFLQVAFNQRIVFLSAATAEAHEEEVTVVVVVARECSHGNHR